MRGAVKFRHKYKVKAAQHNKRKAIESKVRFNSGGVVSVWVYLYGKYGKGYGNKHGGKLKKYYGGKTAFYHIGFLNRQGCGVKNIVLFPPNQKSKINDFNQI